MCLFIITNLVRLEILVYILIDFTRNLLWKPTFKMVLNDPPLPIYYTLSHWMLLTRILQNRQTKMKTNQNKKQKNRVDSLKLKWDTMATILLPQMIPAGEASYSTTEQSSSLWGPPVEELRPPANQQYHLRESCMWVLPASLLMTQPQLMSRLQPQERPQPEPPREAASEVLMQETMWDVGRNLLSSNRYLALRASQKGGHVPCALVHLGHILVTNDKTYTVPTGHNYIL